VRNFVAYDMIILLFEIIIPDNFLKIKVAFTIEVYIRITIYSYKNLSWKISHLQMKNLSGGMSIHLAA